ncbi:MAG: hypothetical protein JW780_02590 [Clostridiales bacterium]|nr:hypothetical protein [Clostridiales bacterium]
MKKIRVIAAVLVIVFSVSVLCSCDQIAELAGVFESAQGASELTGDDYIVYRNSKRDDVMSQYVGKRVDVSKAELLLDNVELSYYEIDAENNEYQIDIDNSNKSYFFNGVVHFVGETEEFTINVRMLPPDWYEYIIVELNEDPESYEYFVEGNIYEWEKELSVDYEYQMDYEGLEMYEGVVVIDTNTLDETVAEAFAHYLYDFDTIYNYDEGVTYYLTTLDEYESGNTDHVYTLFVDTQSSQVVMTIEEPGSDPVEKTLTFQ